MIAHWYHKTPRSRSSQGTVHEEGTGRTVAVAYDPKDTPLLAAAPKFLAVLLEAREALGVPLSRQGCNKLRDKIHAAIRDAEVLDDDYSEPKNTEVEDLPSESPKKATARNHTSFNT